MDNIEKTVYEQSGFECREDYLEHLAFGHGIDVGVVECLADLLGPEEDFDGLITAIENHLDFIRDD